MVHARWSCAGARSSRPSAARLLGMGDVREMLEASPVGLPLDLTAVAAAIEACQVAEQSCTACADADLAEEDVAAMRRCIVWCVSCADVCAATWRTLSRPSAYDGHLMRSLLEACVRACTICAEECDRHAAHHRHCALCAKSCRACEALCAALLKDEELRELENLAGG
jgi:hypothetical protein